MVSLHSPLYTTGKRFAILNLPARPVFLLVLDLGLGLIRGKDLGTDRKGRNCDYHYNYHFFDFHLDFLLVIGANCKVQWIIRFRFNSLSPVPITCPIKKCFRLLRTIGNIFQGLGQE